MFAPRLVERADQPPFRCLLTGLVDGPFVDASVQIESVPMQQPRAYFHPTAIYQLGSEIGMVTEEEHAKATEELSRARVRVEELEAELDRALQETEAIAGLTKGDWQIRKPQGRKPKEKVA